MPNIKITAKSEPYRRAGISHTRAGTVYAAGHFTDEQLARLRADPRLVVAETDEAPSMLLVDAQSLRDAAVATFFREAERMAADKAQDAGENWPGMSAFERESRINSVLSDFIAMAQPVEATRNADLATPEPPAASAAEASEVTGDATPEPSAADATPTGQGKDVAKPATKVTTAKAPAKGKAK
jgi:hypothetical protein